MYIGNLSTASLLSFVHGDGGGYHMTWLSRAIRHLILAGNVAALEITIGIHHVEPLSGNRPTGSTFGYDVKRQ